MRRDNLSATPLHWACRYPSGNMKVIHFLIEAGADINAVAYWEQGDDCNLSTPLGILNSFLVERYLNEEDRKDLEDSFDLLREKGAKVYSEL